MKRQEEDGIYMLQFIRQVLGMLVVLTLITGLAYPLVVTGIAQLVFPHQANGSLIVQDGKTVGSELIGQSFGEAKYFWPRPSATLAGNGMSLPYNAANSGGSNLGPLNPTLADNVRIRAQALNPADPTNRPTAPVDLVTSSASGLDPDISVAAAEYQIPRVAKARNADEASIRKLVAQHTQQRQWGVLGEPRVNVLTLNLALDDTKR